MGSGVLVTGVDLATAVLTFTYIGCLLFQGIAPTNSNNPLAMVKRSLRGQNVVRRAR